MKTSDGFYDLRHESPEVVGSLRLVVPALIYRKDGGKIFLSQFTIDK